MSWQLWTICALCWLSGCATTLDQRASPWKVELPSAARWQLSTAPGCVLALGALKKGEDAPRLLRCHDPADGALRWTKKLTGAQDSPRERLLTHQHLVLYQDTAQVRAFDADSGDLTWRFDPNGRAITAAILEGDRLLLSLNHDTLVVLSARDGRWLRAVALPDHRLLGGLRHGNRRDLLALQLSNGQHRLVAIPQDGHGGDAPRPPFPTARERWSVTLEEPPRAATQIGNTVLVDLHGQEALLLNLHNGATLRRAHLAAPTAANTQPPNTDEDRLAATSLAALSRDQGLPAGHWLAQDQPAALILAHGARQGRWLPLREVSALDPNRWRARWIIALPSGAPLRAATALDDARLLLMTGPEGIVVDARTGLRLRRVALPQGRTGWTDVTHDARALYVVYGKDPKARLEAWPLEENHNAQPQAP